MAWFAMKWSKKRQSVGLSSFVLNATSKASQQLWVNLARNLLFGMALTRS
jgi:hypothetical protein